MRKPSIATSCDSRNAYARAREREADRPHAQGWGGSPCFVDTVETPATSSHARAYLITWGQFEDVVAQENGRATSPVDLQLVDLAAGRSFPLGSGRYENVLCLGRFDEFPVVTFTSPGTMTQAELGAPSKSYLKTMIAGLRESHALSDDAIVGYLGAAPGSSAALAIAALGPHDES